jgi:hypothetical protein
MTSKLVAQSETISQTQNPTGSSDVIRTRSGRVVKKPERYVPVEVCEDDYGTEDYDSRESSDVSSEISIDPEDLSSESDADEHGNLDGFVVEDKSEESDIDSDVQTSVAASSDDDDA